MPSSTSNSRARVPDLPPVKTWLTTALLVIVLCVSAELFWRQQGHTPTIKDDPSLWAHHRGRVYDGGSQAIVLIGASRNQLGICMDTFRSRFPHRNIVQLSINGYTALDVLRDLAHDTDFRGTVVCSVEHSGVVSYSDVSPYLKAYHQRNTFDRRINRAIATRLQENLAFIHPNLQSTRVLGRLLIRGRLTDPSYRVMHHDRSISADYTMLDTEEHRQERINIVLGHLDGWQGPDEQEWQQQVTETERLVEKIQRRGGQVVFVVFPVTDESLGIPDQMYPKPKFWDRFANTTKAVPIHFLDVPTLQGFECPDTSHLDVRDTSKFTNALVDEISRRGVLPQSDTHVELARGMNKFQ